MFEKANRVAQLVSSLKHTHAHTLKDSKYIFFFSFPKLFYYYRVVTGSIHTDMMLLVILG